MNNLIEIINRVSTKLKGITEEGQIYQIMYEGIREILPGVYFLVTKLQHDDMNFRIIHSYGFEKFIMPIQTLLGKNPFEMDFPFSDLNDEKLKAFESGKLFHFEDGIYDLVNGKINKLVCKTIEKILGISDVNAISLSVHNKYFGGATLFFPNSNDRLINFNQDSIFAIETIAAQSSLALNNLRHIESLKKKEDELKISQSRFHQLVKQMNDIVWKANGDGSELTDLSNSFEKYYGYSSAEFVKNPNLWIDVVHPEDKEIAEKGSIDLLKNGEAESEYRIQKPDGSIIWLNDRKSVVFDENGKVVQIGGIATDITEKKKLEEQLKLKNYALEYSPNAIAMADFNGNVIYVNESMVKLFGYENKTEVLGKHISTLSSDANHPELVLKMLKEGKVFTGETKPVRKDGSTFDSIITASMVTHDQKPICAMAVFTDITEQKQQEYALRSQEEKLLKLNQEKDRFLAIIAHDLRSPFNGMLGLLKIMVNDYEFYSEEQRLSILLSIHDSAQNAFNLLTDLLEWSKLQNNKFEIKNEAIDLKEIIDENINLFGHEAEKKEISIKNHIVQNFPITADSNSIKLIVRNILANAIKFTHKGGSIEIDVKKFQDDFELSIKDTGVGMSEETMSKLFSLDQKITMPGTNSEKGTGLGLTICNDLITLNGWKMNIESQLDNGTTFRILITETR